jgi:hypothetical protein
MILKFCMVVEFSKRINMAVMAKRTLYSCFVLMEMTKLRLELSVLNVKIVLAVCYMASL